MKRTFTKLMAALVLLTFLAVPMGMWGQTRDEEVYKQTIFNSNNNSGNIGSYSNNWWNTTNGFKVDIANANNNNNQWDYIKMGSKNSASTGSITTNAAIDKAITKVVVTVGAVKTADINSAKLYVATNSDFTQNLQTIEVTISSTGDVTYTVPTPTANCYYKLEYSIKKDVNGSLQINTVKYYKGDDTPATPTCATPTFSPAAGKVDAGTTVTISSETEGATIQYSVDGGATWTIGSSYTVNEAVTLKAKATKTDYDPSGIATASYTIKGVAVFTDGVYSEPLNTEDSFENMTAVSVDGTTEEWYFETEYDCTTIDGEATGDIDWLITPKMQVDNGKLAISFELWHSIDVSDLLSLKWSTSNDVNGQWNTLDFEDVDGDNYFHEVNVEITTQEPYVYMAFVYDNTTAETAGSYSIMNFVAKQYYNLAFNANIDGATGTMDPLSCVAGVATPLTENAFTVAGKAFNGWNTNSEGTGTSYTDGANITITANTTLYAQWLDAYKVRFTTNGIEDITKQVVKNQAIGTLPTATAAYIPAGYVFKGWLDSEYQMSDNAPSAYITSTYKPQGDVTLYAVFAIPGESSYTLVGPSDVTEGIYLIGALRSTTATNNFYFADGSLSSGDMNTNTTATEINEVSGVRQITTKPTDAQEFEFVGNSSDGFAIRKVNTTDYLGYSANSSRNLAFSSTYSSTKWKAKSKSGSLLTNGIYLETTNYKVSENSTERGAIRGYYQGSVYRAIYLFKKVETLTKYRTSLLTYSDPLAVNGYTLNSDGGYKLIATPVYVSPSTVNGMILTGDDAENYDFYYFDEGQNKEEWRNYKKANFNLEPGKGYLYAQLATSNDPYEFTFSGTPYNGNGEVALSYTEGNQLAGWNLIGNPYTTSATIDKNYYRMNETGDGFVSVTDGSEVAAMEGVFVQATATSLTATFTAQNAKSGKRNIAKVELMVSGNRGTVIDNAIVRFDNGETLEKFVLRENGTKLYFTEGNQDYAIVCNNGEGEMPVNFKANKAGNYTISVNAENTEMNYLHLIDNMTGADVDLLATPSYSFEAKTSDYASRFRLVFNANNGNNENGNETFAYYNGSEWVINNPSTGSGDNATLQVVDMMGRVLSSETISGNANVNINQAAGIYMLRLVNGENVMVQKVVVR